ncbi:transporter substrate-binding domain-containing protein [Eggerthella guodeyinii]|uniref:Transporter substrate-binding domain-containing protein n=1 Tax=Eggerthella guodeyinii TaxID=2690837 RepID=A0A6N7RIH4_9ACTN|nr:transporter substrate-binding domain-containing protein [Eggerthella guodeyinii]MRX80904.1 transporter substrate-binding domain-containing protein [Eggerthella guodeyinii]
MRKIRGGARAKLLLAVLLLSCALAGLAGCASASDDKGTASNGETLRVGVRSDVVGFGYLNDDTGKYYGLEIDIANEMAERMGYGAVEFVSVLPENRKDMLQNGEVDCLVACYSIAESRQKNFDFSPAYYSDDSIVMVENSALIDGVDALKGKTLGTMSGSNTAPQLVIKLTEAGFTSGEALSANEDNSDVVFDTFHLVQMASYQELSKALEEGAIDAACMDGSIAKTYLDADRSILDFTIDTQEYGVATQKDSALSQPVSAAIQGMLDDGTIAQLTDKWD